MPLGYQERKGKTQRAICPAIQIYTYITLLSILYDKAFSQFLVDLDTHLCY